MMPEFLRQRRYNSRYFTIVIAMLSILVIVVYSSCEKAETVADQYEKYIDSAEEVWGFQGSWLLAKGDSILAQGSRGMANLDANRPNTPETKFMIGSLTKSFTAIATMQLVEKGLIDLDKTISDYLSDYPTETGNEITVHHLLCHRSGIPDPLRNREFIARMGSPIEPAEIVSFFKDQPLDFQPGEKYEYSSANYVLLGLIIEAVSGQAWEDYIEVNICGTCGMLNTAVFKGYADREDVALGHSWSEHGGGLSILPVIHPSFGYSAGALTSTVGDLFKLNLGLYSGSLLSPESIELMLTPHSPTYGYGWYVDDFGGHSLTGHGGGVPGISSLIQRWVDDSVCVVVLCNRSGLKTHTIANALAAIALDENVDMPVIKKPIDVKGDALTEYEGKYVRQSGEHVVISILNGVLNSQVSDGRPYQLLPESTDKFFLNHDMMTTITFIRDSTNTVNSYILAQAFERDTAILIERGHIITPSDSVISSFKREIL